tara:strand:- start:58428 stop:59633 length:1206 start_codon:yes stop_codon:yes gene_type:complete
MKNFKPKFYKKENFLKFNLSKSVFNKSKFNQCNFWETKLIGAKFINSEIDNSVFSDAKLNNSKFENCLIKNSNFSHTDLRNSDFSKSNLINVNFRDAIYNKKTKWPKNFKPMAFGAKKISNKVKKNKIKKKIIFSKLEKRILKELTIGKGYYILENYIDKKIVKKASALIKKEIFKDKNIKKNYNNFSRDKRMNQTYVYKNLFNLNKVFVKLVQPKIAMKIFKEILGNKFICGFFGANCLLPGARGQSPHLDYPYLDIVKAGEKLPFETGKNFALNCQILIPLTDFNYENGSTSLLPHSHKTNLFPNKKLAKNKKFVQIKTKAGSLILTNGLIWHNSMPNYTDNEMRICTLGQYLPHFIKPMLNLSKSTNKKILDNDKNYLKQLLGINLRYPRDFLTTVKY